MKSLKNLCAAVAITFATMTPASAWWMSSDTGMSLSVGAGSYLLNNEIQRAARASRKGVAGGVSTAQLARTGFQRNSRTAALDMLVGYYPPAQRPQMRQGFLELHRQYPQVARQLGVPTNDVATGLASFLAGAYMAYNNQNVSNSHVKPLANQLRRALAAERDFAQVTDAEKQRMYDATVMLGMLMATTQVQLQRQPDPMLEAQMRQLGKEMIEGFLKVDASRLRITSSGMRIV
jgi:hypothetical protein